VGNHPGFAAAGSSYDEQRAIDGFDGLFLRGVESFQ
jgi:hypothetical protein